MLEVLVGNRPTGDYSSVTTWIDTAFDGRRVLFPGRRQHVELQPASWGLYRQATAMTPLRGCRREAPAEPIRGYNPS